MNIVYTPIRNMALSNQAETFQNWERKIAFLKEILSTVHIPVRCKLNLFRNEWKKIIRDLWAQRPHRKQIEARPGDRTKQKSQRRISAQLPRSANPGSRDYHSLTKKCHHWMLWQQRYQFPTFCGSTKEKNQDQYGQKTHKQLHKEKTLSDGKNTDNNRYTEAKRLSNSPGPQRLLFFTYFYTHHTNNTYNSNKKRKLSNSNPCLLA